MRTLKRLACTFSLVLWICAAWPVQKGVIVNNFGPGDAYNESTGWTIGFSPCMSIQGDAFIPAASVTLGEFELAVSLAPAGPSEIRPCPRTPCFIRF